MQNSSAQFTFSVLNWRHPFLVSEGKPRAIIVPARPYGSRDFEIGSCRQHGFSILLR